MESSTAVYTALQGEWSYKSGEDAKAGDFSP